MKNLGLNAKELQAFDKFIKDFTFPEIPPNVPFTLLAGVQGSGKTHLALTLTEKYENVFLLDTELRGNIVARKFPKVKYAQVKTYLQLYGIIKHITEKYEKGIIILDSASDLQQFAEVRYKEVAKLEKVWPQYLWAQVFDMCDEIIKMVRESNLGMILTARMKEEYVNDKPTGNFIPRVYNRLPYNVDIILELQKTDKGRKLFVTKDGYNDKLGEISYEANLNNILTKIIKGE